MNTAIVFLTTTPKEETLNFAKKIAKKFDTYIVIDNNDIADKPSDYKDVNYIYMFDNICIKKGYYNSNIIGQTHIKKNPIALDKFLFYFCEINTIYDNIWVFEDDVFIPSVETIVNLNNKYNSYDLVTPRNELKQDNVPDWHWRFIFDKIKHPYYQSMVCAMMLSKNALKEIRTYVDKNKTLFYLEAMFNTLAMQANLKVVDAKELKSIVWQGFWGVEHFYKLQNNVFHPKKDLENFRKYRAKIKKMNKQNVMIEIDLPRFLI